MNIEEIPNQNAQAPVDLHVGFDAPNKTLDQRPAIESQKQVEGQGELPQKPDSESNIGDQEQKQSPADLPRVGSSKLPILYLPSDVVSVRESSLALMGELKKTGIVFSLRGQMMRLEDKRGSDYSLSPITSQELPSFSQQFFSFHRKDWRENGERVLDLPRQFTKGHAAAILGCTEAVNLLPKISKTLSFPPVDAEGRILQSGYHPEHELLVLSKVELPKVPTDEAVDSLLNLLTDWRWETPADLSRAIAALLAPMIRLGVNLKPSLIMPVFMVEADQSQTGKGHLINLIASIYNEPVTLIAQKKGGVGSLDESFSKALMGGRPLISFDNLRGKINSAALEAFVTANGNFNVRALRTEGCVDSRHFVIYGTSNQFEATTDLANRTCAIRIRRQRECYRWKEWPEGSLLEHVKANHAFYLGAVAAVVESWTLDGMQTMECHHPQREWASAMNWIVQRIFRLPPLLEGHSKLTLRVADPLTGFLTELGNEIQEQGDTLTVSEMITIAKAANVRLPVNTEGDHPKGEQLQLGALISQAFGEGHQLEINGHLVERITKRVRRPDGDGYFESKAYRFNKPANSTAATAATTG
jgi:hypothetical protein